MRQGRGIGLLGGGFRVKHRLRKARFINVVPGFMGLITRRSTVRG